LRASFDGEEQGVDGVRSASRIANVAAVLPVGGPPGLARLLAFLFEETLQVDAGRDPLPAIAAALASTRADRVLVVHDPRAGAELLLALVAWPERAALVAVDDATGAPLCALLRRADCLGSARIGLADQRAELDPYETFLAAVGTEVERVTPAGLGLPAVPDPLFSLAARPAPAAAG